VTGDHYVSEPSAIGQPSRPTQPFILFMTDADNEINPLHLGSDPVDSQIRNNLDSNLGSLVDEASKVQGVRCTWRRRRYK